MRAFNDAGEALDRRKMKRGRSISMPRAGVSAGGRRERGRLAMDAVREHLDTGRGLKLLHPPYRSFPKGVGSLLNYPPGLKENGAIFCHAHTWASSPRPCSAGGSCLPLLPPDPPPRAARSAGRSSTAWSPMSTASSFGPDHPALAGAATPGSPAPPPGPGALLSTGSWASGLHGGC